MYFLFNRTTLQIFVTYLTGALYVRPLWFYKHQHDNRVRSKLFVACQRWWFQWRFWFVPSVPGYTRTLSLETVHTTFDGIVRWWLFPEFGAELPLDNCTPTIIFNNPVYRKAPELIMWHRSRWKRTDYVECILFYSTESILYIYIYDTTTYMLKNNHLYMSKTIF